MRHADAWTVGELPDHDVTRWARRLGLGSDPPWPETALQKQRGRPKLARVAQATSPKRFGRARLARWPTMGVRRAKLPPDDPPGRTDPNG